METKKKQDYKKLLGYIKHNDLEHKTFNKTFNRICFNNEEYAVVVKEKRMFSPLFLFSYLVYNNMMSYH